MRVPVYVVVGVDPQTSTVNPVLCNEDYNLAKAAMDEMIDAIELSSMTMKPAQREEVQATLNTFRIVEGVLELPDDL